MCIRDSFNVGGANHPGIAKRDQHRTFGMFGEGAGHPDRAQFIGGAAAGTHGRVPVAVSYTHLDVYKRQAKRHRAGGGILDRVR